jgi:fatty-acyl-CoA synthase
MSGLSRPDVTHPRSVHGEGMTLSAQVARHARTIPDAVALTQDGVHRTYAELHARAGRLANALTSLGVRSGDRVAVMARNCPETMEAYVACTRLGAVCVPVGFRLTAAEVAHQLGHSGTVVVVVDAEHAATVREAISLEGSGAGVRHVLVIGDDLEAALAAEPEEYAEHPVDEAGPAFIMYTSGTTGRPKGAVLSHQNLYHQTVSRAMTSGLPVDCRTWLIGTPLSHIAALATGLPAILLGGRIVLAPGGPFDAAHTLALLERERVSYCFFVPSQWQEIVRSPALREHDLSALRMITWGAAPATSRLVHELLEAFPEALVGTSFGQTETSPTTTVLLGQEALRKPGSVGRPLVNVECRVVDDRMVDVAPGQVGEIVYRGPMVMLGYWQDPQATAEAFRGGWFHSGDLVRQDEDGYLHVVDRLKDMIISGGENVYCAEVEDVLAAHPGVSEVAVVGVPHPTWGETPLAVVVPRDGQAPDAAELEEWARGRLASFKVPRQVRFTTQLPRNASGKVLKEALRSAAREDRLPASATTGGDR